MSMKLVLDTNILLVSISPKSKYHYIYEAFIREAFVLITRYYKWKLIEADSDDNKFVDCGLAANAKYIVTNDKHFNILKTLAFPKVNIIGIDKFCYLE